MKRLSLSAVCLCALARVAQKYVHKDRLAVLVVGKAADFDKPLSTYGPVTTINVTIPSATGGPGKSN